VPAADQCDDLRVVAIVAIAVVLVAAFGVGGVVFGLLGWRVASDVRRREREGTDPESLNWRSRYFRGYPRD
jgi:hypothetical protein